MKSETIIPCETMNTPQTDSAVRANDTQPILLSTLGQCLLQGIIFCQMVSFHQRQTTDSLRLKVFVYTLFILCLVQTAQEIYKIWTVSIDGLEWNTNPAHYIEFPLNSVICSSVQAFLVRRVWKVTGRRFIILFPLVSLAFITLLAGLAMSVNINRFLQTPFASVTNCRGFQCIPEFSIWLWGSAVLDATITTTLSVYLLKSKTGFHRLDAVVTKIWNLTLITAALPMIAMLAAISLFYSTGGGHYRTVIGLIIISSKLYFNGLLRNLNVRNHLRTSLQESSLGRRSIVTIGSPAPRHARRVSNNDTLTEALESFDVAEGATSHKPDGHMDRDSMIKQPPILSLRKGKVEFDLERGNSMPDLLTESSSNDHDHMMPSTIRQPNDTPDGVITL